MGKRKADGEMKPPSKMEVDDEGEGSDDDASIINVDFEWFDLQSDIDFHGLKTLLRQLFDADNELFDLSELTDMILAQAAIGSTVKCEGIESDPYAFLTVLNLHHHREKKVIKQLIQYLLHKSASGDAMKQLQALLSPTSGAQVGLILTERFINMPHQVIPPLYNMILEEMKTVIKDGEPYNFTHYLIVSKTYTEVASALDGEDARPQKKKKGAALAAETFYFHPEDEVLQKHAAAHCNYDYSKQGEEGASDSKRAFQELGVKPQGLLMLIDGKEFEGAVRAVGEYLGADA